jgi:hypothetical protein
LAVVNAELRVPLLGSTEFGLLNFPFLPTEIAPFFDAGIAYTSTQAPDFRFVTNETEANSRVSQKCLAQQQQRTNDPNAILLPCADRIPVFSTGVSARINFLGYLIFEAYLAHPFQRPQRNWVWGFQLAPGW